MAATPPARVDTRAATCSNVQVHIQVQFTFTRVRHMTMTITMTITSEPIARARARAMPAPCSYESLYDAAVTLTFLGCLPLNAVSWKPMVYCGTILYTRHVDTRDTHQWCVSQAMHIKGSWTVHGQMDTFP